MPCFDGRTAGDDEIINELARERNKVEWRDAALCALMTVMENQGFIESIIASVDWSESGIKEKDLRDWWEKHKEQDVKRRQQEAKQEAARALRKEKKRRRDLLIASMSPEEREILGFK